jgi:hypothetical protein
MTDEAHDEFYVGYLPDAPPALGRWLKSHVRLLWIGAALVALSIVATLSPFSNAAFEFGVVRSFRGVLTDDPAPTLIVARPGSTSGGTNATSRYLLVAPFKFGASELIADHLGRHVELEGSLIHRDGRTMLELVPDSIVTLDTPGPSASPTTALGERTYRGEIVDSKCYLGVMKPGNLKPHRACAANCIRGGIPPVLLVRTEAGARYLLLVDENGGTVNDRVLDLIAEPIEVTGEVIAHGEQLVLRADPATYRRL